jgi:Family of unknown function (DUF6308)
MARKRPRLIPTVDSVARRALEIDGDSWIELRAALRAAGVVERVETMHPTGLSFSVSTLRLLDAAIWMRHSQGREARKARVRIGA